MDQQTLLSSKVDTNRIVFSDAKSQKDGGNIKSARITYRYGDNEDSSKMVIQTAKMRVPFGISNDEKFGNGNKWDIRLSFQGEERTKSIQRFRECIERINTSVINKCLENCSTWLEDEELGDERLLRKCFKSSIKKSKKENYSDMFRISIPFNKENTAPRSNIEFYNSNAQQIDWTEVKPGSEVVCLIEINGIWISPGTNQFGLSVRLVQMQVFQTKQLKGFHIQTEIDDLEDNDDELEDNDEDSVEADNDEEIVEVESD